MSAGACKECSKAETARRILELIEPEVSGYAFGRFVM